VGRTHKPNIKNQNSFVEGFPATMFLRIVSDSFTRKPRRKALTAPRLALAGGTDATLEVSLDVGDAWRMNSALWRNFLSHCRGYALSNRRRRLPSRGCRPYFAEGDLGN